MNPNVALVVFLLIDIVFIALVYMGKGWFIRKYGPQGYALYLGFSASYLLPATAWLLGISSLFNDVANLFLTGAGGQYGLNFAYYPEAMTIYLVPVVAASVITAVIPAKKKSAHSAIEVLHKLSSHMRVDRIAYIALIGAAFLMVWYFSVVGWSRFWHSDLGRFEFQGEGQAATSIKLSLSLILAFGCLGAALVVFRGLFWVSTVTVLLSILPFFAFASRGSSVLVTAYIAGVFLKLKTKWRWVALVPACYVLYASLQLPLSMRGSGQTGVAVALSQLKGDDQVDFGSTIAACMQNIGQGFGLAVEEREMHDLGNSVTTGVPLMYFMLSMSPTISSIDGFSEKWVDYNPRFNLYTPYSGLCEVNSLNLALGFVFPVSIWLLATWLCRAQSGRSLWNDTALYAFSLITILGFIQLQQYPLRTGVRFFYAAYALFFAFYSLTFFAKNHASVQAFSRIAKVSRQAKGPHSRGRSVLAIDRGE